MLRPALIPSAGNSLVVADWAGIEARVNPWLSNCDAGVAKLSLFARGEDVYKVNASATFHIPVDDVNSEQRQIGKVQELACGFAGGIGAFAAMGRAYGILLPEPQAKRMVNAWRVANPWATPYWQDLEEAYTRAMRNPNREFSAGRVTYMYDGLHLWYALPSGRVLCYPFAKLEADGITYAKSAWKPAADAKEWPRARLWKGLACENITQAVANDLLRNSMRICESEGLEIVLTVHDEIVLECADEDAERATKRLTEIMCTPPDWAKGIPLGVETNTMKRYGK
jgi:DNA polymerase